MTEQEIRQLLPPNATRWEKNLALIMSLFYDAPVPLRDLWNPDRCPVALLPYLAWAFSVDRWDSDWTEAQKRAAIKNAFYLHQHKGTVAAVKRAVTQYGASAEIIEWWQEDGIPGTFRLNISIPDTGLDDKTISGIKRMVYLSKPLSRHITDMVFIEEATVTTWCAAALIGGSVITIEAGE
ncbi:MULTISPECIES: phage tail protein I [unclassified Pantoea]|uniref:phage tail protein I n=1 Tax=unclassified Pantoea TaxID=2630326 RepID=UPI0012325242|nr:MULTISPECIES: phage tail protein I [unclassified Pantoea]KAA5952059.1 phage tail protein I [Pantoea sp. VH_24]KAA5953411.1 phage tail protein I [Pantoea sp. VH_16]KAA5961647.1 phage tail protein I [Pantoea sp. VH_18]KAA5993355.1 phage tail protein I [Pantoea sp. M_1]KAA5998119.1 phage tail protein I [Pantoea sp. F_7]